jgi:RNA polymerase sigma-70 factor (ECF subfamily)
MDTGEEDLAESVYREAQAGDQVALETIVRFHQRPIRAWIAAHCPAGGDADDVAQRTFIAALTRIAEFEVGTRFRAWLYTIARYQVMTEATRLRRLADYHSRYAPELLSRELERRAEEADDTSARQVHHLRACIEGLQDRLQELIGWRYTEEIPLAEMAERSGRSVSAIKKQLWLTRRKLQACIEAKRASASGEMI